MTVGDAALVGDAIRFAPRLDQRVAARDALDRLVAEVEDWHEGYKQQAAVVRDMEADRDAARAEVERLQQALAAAEKWANTMEHERDWEIQVVHCELLAERDAARAEAGKLRQAWRANVDDLTAQYGEVVKRLEAEAGKLRAALAFYANQPNEHGTYSDVLEDGGDRARAALAGSDAPPTPSEAE